MMGISLYLQSIFNSYRGRNAHRDQDISFATENPTAPRQTLCSVTKTKNWNERDGPDGDFPTAGTIGSW